MSIDWAILNLFYQEKLIEYSQYQYKVSLYNPFRENYNEAIRKEKIRRSDTLSNALQLAISIP